MKKIKKYKNKIIGLLFILFTTLIIGWSLEEPEEQKKEENKVKIEKKQTKKETEEIKKIKIDIKGEINTPGVYELTEDNNVMDAINQAGGLTNKSDTSNINLSKKLKDEMVIIVYSKQEIINMKEKEKITCPPCNNACIEEKDEASKIDIKEETKEETGKININTADIEELQKLNGIGETKAQAIIEYRNKNGGFKDIEEIKNVQGIGEAAFEKIKDNITI
ncbi:MAG: ComEA family DNA-binding protein [Bacilli bacterium]|nr:ComEA family DNA-binding protein [Bacilli bacterium]